MKRAYFEIKENDRLADRTYEMKLTCPDNSHGVTRPGQFINIRLDGFFLRRPISVCDWTETGLTIIYKTVGAGTEAMSQMQQGERLDILTPLGNGFDVDAVETATAAARKRPVLVGGGVGVPPMYGLCRELLARGERPMVILGFNSENECFYIDEFKELGADVMVTTADGSVGRKGFVTDALADVDCGYICACGPEGMLRAIDETVSGEVGGQFSFEERMGCGFGACMGCSCETKYGSKRICKEGPVLERGEIIW